VPGATSPAAPGAPSSPNAPGAWPGVAGQGGFMACEVDAEAIAPDPEQPRRSHSEARLDLLAEDVRARGVIEPLVLRPHPDPAAAAATPYMLVVGERRWIAARRAGLAAVPALVRRDLEDPEDRLMLQIAENDGELREDLTLYERARAVERAWKLAGVRQAEFARRHRRSRAWISEMLTLARAEGLAEEALREGRLAGTLAARTFLRLDAGQQRRLLAQSRRDDSPITLGLAEKGASRSERAARRRFAAGEGEAGEDGADAPGALPTPAPPDLAAAPPVSFGGRPATSEPASSRPPAPPVAGAAAARAPLPAVPATADAAAPAVLPAGAAPAFAGDPAGAAFPAPAVASGEPLDPAAMPGTGWSAGVDSPGPAAAVVWPTTDAGRRSAAASFLSVGEALGRARRGGAAAAEAASLLPARFSVHADGPRVTLELTVPQLERLLVLVGLEPEGPPQHQVRQLLNCL
jgi:ParB/RepB/Spo0J family partition protein